MTDSGHHGEDERDVNSFLVVSKLSSIAHRQPSTLTRMSIEVPAGHQVVDFH